MKEKRLEVSDIFQELGDSYKQSHNLTVKQSRVISAISLCRSGFLGIHKQRCTDCSHEEYHFNSCRDRHCPKCQYTAKESWVSERMKGLLAVPYYHIVFTLASELNLLIYQNQKRLYHLLFESSSQTLLTFGKDRKHLGGKIGALGILHTWGQTLWYHPHIHYIVPGGGISFDGSEWIPARGGEKFIFPELALSDVFCGKFISGLKKLWHSGQLELQGQLEYLQSEQAFEELLSKATHKRWVVYAKEPFSTPEYVLKYLGRYTHRVAMASSRLERWDGEKVEFGYKDYRDHNIQKTCHLSGEEFLRRFLWHVLPEGFQKIRYFGFWASASYKKNLAMIRQLIKQFQNKLPLSKQILLDLSKALLPPQSYLCPVCHQGKMIFDSLFAFALEEGINSS